MKLELYFYIKLKIYMTIILNRKNVLNVKKFNM